MTSECTGLSTPCNGLPGFDNLGSVTLIYGCWGHTPKSLSSEEFELCSGRSSHNKGEHVRRLLPLVLFAALTACGTDTPTLSDIEVSGSDEPEISVEEGFETDETTSKVISPGDGETVHAGDVVNLDYVGVDGRTGKVFDNSFQSEQSLTATLIEGEIIDGFIKGLDGKKVGSRVLVAVAPDDGFEQNNDQYDLRSDDSLVFVFDINDKIPESATGKKKSVPKTVPRLTFDDQDRPDGFTKTKKTPDKVTDEKAYLAVEGSGDKVQSGDTLVVQYVGQVYPDGDVFDESWSHGPATFSVGTGRLIKCWDDLLVDQKVGSRVILVCPAKYAYGEEGNDKIKGGDTLIFAIDLLAAN